MPVTPTIPSLRFCIVANHAEIINKIKLLFDSATNPPLLINSFNSFEEFLQNAVNENMDFIASDHSSLSSFGNENQVVFPIILIRLDERTMDDIKRTPFEELSISAGEDKVNETLAKIEKTKNEIITIKNGEQVAAKKISKTFLTRKGKEYVPLTIENIPAFYTDNKITFAYDTTGRKFMINMALIELENSLDSSMFFRANRQYLINRNFINRVKQLEEGRYEIIITAAEPIHVEINQQKFAKLKQWVEW